MDTAVSMQTWFEQSRPFFASLSDFAGGDARQEALELPTAGAADTAGGPLKSLQRWIVTNPCPDKKLGDRLNLMVARYGYLELASAADRTPLDDEERAALTEHLWESIDDVVARIAEAEQFGTGHSADRDES
jgi:hypothetical protein